MFDTCAARASWRRRSPAKTCSSTTRPRFSGGATCRLAPDPRTGFEMTLVRMLAFRPAEGASATAGPCHAVARGGRREPRGPSPATGGPSCGRRRRAPSIRCNGRASSAISTYRCGAPARDQLRARSSIAATPCGSASIRRWRVRRRRSSRLTQALAKYLGEHVKLEFVEGAATGGDSDAARRAALGRSARRRAAHRSRKIPTVRELKRGSARRCIPNRCGPRNRGGRSMRVVAT